MTDKFDTIVELANEALEHRRKENREAFKECIAKIAGMDDHQLYKADLINLIAFDKYYDTDTWINDFIIYDLKYASGARAAGLLVMLLMTGTGDVEEVYKRELVAALSRSIHLKDFYDLEAGILASDLPEHLLPVIFDHERRHLYDKPDGWEPDDFYILDDNGRIIVNRSDFLVRETLNFYKHYKRLQEERDRYETTEEFKVYDEYPSSDEHREEDPSYWKNRGEEIEFRDCFDEDDNPVIAELEKIAYYNTKARQTLLELEGKEYDAWFGNNQEE